MRKKQEKQLSHLIFWLLGIVAFLLENWIGKWVGFKMTSLKVLHGAQKIIEAAFGSKATQPVILEIYFFVKHSSVKVLCFPHSILMCVG